MLEKFTYINHLGESLDFGEYSIGLFADPHELRNYEWEFDSYHGKISSFYKGLATKSLPILMATKSEKDGIELRNRLFEIMEKDVLAMKPGKILIGDYYVNGYITKNDKSDWVYSGKYIRYDFSMTMEDPNWRKESTYTFSRVVETAGGEDPPMDFPFDFGYASETSTTVIDNNCIGSSPFKLDIYGPCTNPSIEIGGHIYRINGTIAENEFVEVVADKSKGTRTIKKIAIGDMSEVNWFGHRYKEQSIFEEIPSGKIRVNWDGSFGFNLTLIDSRSEPQWTYVEDESNDQIDYSKLLMDSNGGYILDSESNYISVEG